MKKITTVSDSLNIELKDLTTISSSRENEENLNILCLEKTVDGHAMGVWECTPGYFRRQVISAEYCQIISGECRFIYDDGEVLVLKAGDSAYFPQNTEGEWHIISTLRKAFFVLEA